MRRTLLCLILFFCAAVAAYAQPGNPPPPDPGDPVPLSGIELLIGAGAIVGIRKLIKKGRNTN